MSDSRLVVVTGAASGIGRAVCETFAAAGDRVVAVDRRAEPLEEAVAALRRAHRVPVRALVADLAEPGAAAGLADRARAADAAGEPATVLVNAAGLYPAVPLLELTPDAWDRVLDVNLRAAALTTVGFARTLVAAGRPGAVVNISSGAAVRARPGAAAYCTSKAALEMLTRACAVELGEHGIRVNAVSPGFVPVDSAANPVTEEYAAAVSPNPLGRPGRPEDIARAVHWLAGDDAAWTTGAVLRVDGGSTAGTTALPLHWPPATAQGDAAPAQPATPTPEEPTS